MGLTEFYSKPKCDELHWNKLANARIVLINVILNGKTASKAIERLWMGGA